MTQSRVVERNCISSLSTCKLQFIYYKLYFEMDKKMVVFWILGYEKIYGVGNTRLLFLQLC